MSTNIIQALENAEHNMKNRATVQLAQLQVHRARVLLEKGYGPYEEIDPLIAKYGSVEAVPESDDY